MKEKTINVYTFDELGEEAKEKVLTVMREENDHHFLEDSLKEYLNEKLKENNIINCGEEVKLYYSLSCCQGDGASFCGLFKWNNYFIDIQQGSLSNHYSHSNTTDITITEETEEGEEPEADEKVHNQFKELYDSICKDVEKYGYSYIESEDSEESIKENIETNGYTFREDGVMENI